MEVPNEQDVRHKTCRHCPESGGQELRVNKDRSASYLMGRIFIYIVLTAVKLTQDYHKELREKREAEARKAKAPNKRKSGSDTAEGSSRRSTKAAREKEPGEIPGDKRKAGSDFQDGLTPRGERGRQRAEATGGDLAQS
jgi:hypothetical protein